MRIIAQLPEDAAAFLSEIDVTNPQRVTCYTVTGNIELRFGDSGDFAAKFALAKSVIEEEIAENSLRSVVYLDVGVLDAPVILRR